MNAFRLVTAAIVMTLAPLADLANAQVDDAAKAILLESAQAIKNASGVQFSSRKTATGIMAGIIDATGTVKLVRNKDMKSALVLVDGSMKQPQKNDLKITFTSDGQNATWLNMEERALYERPVTDKLAVSQARMASQIVHQAFTDVTPYERDLQGVKIARLSNESIGGEVCDVVEITPNAAAQTTITWAISAIDRLPRRWVQASGKGDKMISLTYEVSDLKVVPLTAKDIAIDLPANFTLNLAKPAPTEAPIAGTAPAAAPVEQAKLGLEPSSPLPSFKLTDSAGKDFTSESVRGTVSVLHFFSPVIKSSHAQLEDLQAISETMKDKVKVVSLACREPTKTAATDLFASRQISYELVPNADSVLADMKVVGFPSIYVLKADGTVAAFLQGTVTRNQILEAVDRASKN